ncbi:hypothetical protein [Streptomyces phaeochromogenes]|uniref:hypothetical protein n=1 Tax=Streptomyces phaeochromogenes TaxID=1923 RepID=UPI002DD92032|nr:hypothetical protein [Streptomyces phaeochromogenes]WRZ30187.1 hypothetical protein OG931_21775 [Streptomyces phaeochromogenes]
MAPATATEAATVLAQCGKHSHLRSEDESVCISGHCAPAATVLGTSLLRPADTRPAGFAAHIHLAGGHL